MGHHAFIGIGSNIDPERNIIKAVEAIHIELPVLEISRFYLTTPIGGGNATGPWFINGVIHVLSRIEARPLKFSLLRGIERTLGRTRTDDKYAERPIDLDLLLFDDRIVMEEGLILPSPQIVMYPFVGVPLSELVPDLRLPGPGRDRPLREIAAEMDTSGMVYLERFTRDLWAIVH